MNSINVEGFGDFSGTPSLTVELRRSAYVEAAPESMKFTKKSGNGKVSR